jgi:hypothetical protein
MVLKGTASTSFKIPPYTAYILVDGYVGPRYGVANFSISPPPPTNLTTEMMNLSTNRTWFAPAPLFYTPLFFMDNYTLTISTTPETAGDGVHLRAIWVLPANSRRVSSSEGAYLSVTIFPG